MYIFKSPLQSHILYMGSLDTKVRESFGSQSEYIVCHYNGVHRSFRWDFTVPGRHGIAICNWVPLFSFNACTVL